MEHGHWSMATVTEVGDKDDKKNSRSLWIERFEPSSSTSVVVLWTIFRNAQRFVSNSTPHPGPTFKEVSATTPDPVSDPATLVSAP